MVMTPRELLLRIISIVQIITAIAITCVGIAITVKFRKIHHEDGTPYEAALNYIDNPWTTKYAAGVWMGLIVSSICLSLFNIFNMFIFGPYYMVVYM